MKKYPAFLKTYGPYFIFIVSEIGLYLSFQHHDARFHWFLHFFVGASAALLTMCIVTWLRRKPVSFPLLWILVGHFFATFPDILFTFFSILHEQWMDVFLFHISVHFVPGRNFTWYSIFLITLAMYLYTSNKVSSGLHAGTPNNSTPYLIDCQPSSGFSSCVHVAVFIAAPVEKVFAAVAPIIENSAFFPAWEFVLVGDSPVRVGSVYRMRHKYQRAWTTHRIVALEPNERLAGEQMQGFFAKYRFNHRFIPTSGGMISDEIWEYTLPYGKAGLVLDQIYVKKAITTILCQGHARLKAYVEK